MKLTFGALIAALACAAAQQAAACPADTRLSPRATQAKTWLERVERGEIPLAQIVAASGPPAQVGRWLPPRAWPLTAIHAALLPTGDVLVYSRKTARPDDVEAALWDPVTEAFSPVALERDLFCGGLALLADGRLFMAGGNDVGCPYQGIADTHVFDPFAAALHRLGDMAVARWYPTSTVLADGRVLITSGLDRRCRLTPLMEIYTPGAGVETVPGGARSLELYPRLHLLSTGEVAHVGIEPGAAVFDPERSRWRKVATSHAGRRWAGASVEVPGHPDSILILGGNMPPTASVERIDFDRPSPSWRQVAPMHLARAHHHAVILPDATVLVIGGGGYALYQDPVLDAELYDPEADTWSLLPAQALPRMYHSTALLLPDGRVLSAGQDHGPSIDSAEIYEPAYLFRGPRPRILEAPERLIYGRAFPLRTDDPAAIASVVLIAPGRVTHGVDMGQRLVALDFSPIDGDGVGDYLQVVPPAQLTLAPRGYYLLFAVDRDGVPSVGRFVQLTVPAKPQPQF